MRDGTLLYADVYRPKQQSEPLPILLMRLPYGREIASTVVYAHPSWYAAQGFIVVIQAVRGCDRSQGQFYPMQAIEMDDGFDTLQWCQTLPGTNGKIGMYGFSYQGITQFQAMAAGGAQVGLTAIAPGMGAIDFYRGWCYWGGALALNVALPWGVQLAQDQAQFHQLEPHATELGRARSRLADWLDFTPLDRLELLRDRPVGEFYFDWVKEAIADSDYYRRLNPQVYLTGQCDLPGLHIAGWADSYLAGTLQAYEWMVQQSDAPQHLIVGPWQHLPWSRRVGQMDFGPEASPQIDRLQVQWFNRWLKGKSGFDSEAPVRLFEMGANRWRRFESWPPPTRSQRLWLASDGLANGPDSDGRLLRDRWDGCGFDTYVCDPRIANPTTPYGPYDQRVVHQRSDLLLYNSEPLQEQLAIAGAPTLHFYASSTAVDTDWVVKLVRVTPSGEALLMTAGVLRARFRQSRSQPQLLTPEAIEHYVIPLRATCWQVRVGERLQVAIASAAFPWIDRNPNTGQWPASASFSDFHVATQTIFHSTQYPSHLELPLLHEPR